MQGKPTVRVAGSNYQGRDVPLTSHPDTYAAICVRSSIREHADDGLHATVVIDGYWHSSHVAMTLPELAQFRDAINAVLEEAEDA